MNEAAAHSAGMVVFDMAACQFAEFYDPAAKATFQAFHKVIEALGGTSLGLTPHDDVSDAPHPRR